jgi:phosphate:Na+ symporter
MMENLNAPSYDDVTVTKASDKEEDINRFRNKLRKENVSKLGTEGYNANSAMIFTNLFSSLEKIGDHLINISEAVVGEI